MAFAPFVEAAPRFKATANAAVNHRPHNDGEKTLAEIGRSYNLSGWTISRLSGMKKVQTTICYLCGKLLCPPKDVDHPVGQQIFPPEIRRKHNLSQLITLDVHKACNTAYHSDEDYFVRSLMPFASGSEAGNAIYTKVLTDFRNGKEVLLTKMVLNEFDPNPSGLFLPGGKVVKRFDGERLGRVAWKMVRGLHFYHTGEVLPEKWPTLCVEIFAGETPPPADVLCFVAYARSHGSYPGAFDYKFEKFPEYNLHYWWLLLWDRINIRVHFHDPACECETCTSARQASEAAAFLSLQGA
jgi:hypothetical protein